MIYYPKSALPNQIQFLPTGGPNGGAAFKIDSSGSEAVRLAIRRPLPKLSDWNTSIEYTVNTLNMLATANGYEGCGVHAELMKHGPTKPIVLASNQLLGGGISPDWHTVKTGWHSVTQQIKYQSRVQPEVENLQFVVKGPVGGHVLLSQWSVVNQYQRFYDTLVAGSSSSIALTRNEHQNFVWYSYANRLSYTRTTWSVYMETIPAQINKGETVRLDFSGVLGAVSDSDSDVPIELKAAAKFRAPNGDELWKDIASVTHPDAVLEEGLIEDSTTFTADRDYTQIEHVLLFQTRFGRVHSTSLSHRGMRFACTTTRPLISTNG